MNGNKYEIQVVERPLQQLVGLKTRTSMARAMIDCHRLWEEEFGPRMPEVAAFPGASYGASLMFDPQTQDFEYWAALPWRAGDPVPEGMARLDLPAGLYAECDLKSLDDLPGAYQHIFETWLPDSGYDVRPDAPCYEIYPADYLETGLLSLYMPLEAKDGD